MNQLDAFAGDGDRLDELIRFGFLLRLCLQGAIRAESGRKEKRDRKKQRHGMPPHGQPFGDREATGGVSRTPSAGLTGVVMSRARRHRARRLAVFYADPEKRATDERRLASSPIRFPGSPEGWWGDEALQAEAQAPQAPREQRHQAAGNIPALRSRGLFSAGVRFATASHMPVDTAQWRASDSTSTSRSSRSVRVIWLSSSPKPRVLKSENIASMPQRRPSSKARWTDGGCERAMIHGSGWPASCTIATLVRTRVSVSSMSLSRCSPRAKHAASVVSPPSSNTRRSCLTRNRPSQPCARHHAIRAGEP